MSRAIAYILPYSSHRTAAIGIIFAITVHTVERTAYITFITPESLYKTLRLASMLDSLVRVSRRVRQITDLLALVSYKELQYSTCQ